MHLVLTLHPKTSFLACTTSLNESHTLDLTPRRLTNINVAGDAAKPSRMVAFVNLTFLAFLRLAPPVLVDIVGVGLQGERRY